MTKHLPFSEACERNQQPILAVIQTYLTASNQVLEIGSGTGQHALFFANALPQIKWYPTDRQANIDGILLWVEQSAHQNIAAPMCLDVLTDPWPNKQFDAAFSANTAHIMPWHAVEATFAGLQSVLKVGAHYFLYGPFNYQGKYTSDSNRLFDNWLKQQASHQSIRHFEDVEKLAEKYNLSVLADHAMPANNRLLVFIKN